jgi:hypothetical protein
MSERRIERRRGSRSLATLRHGAAGQPPPNSGLFAFAGTASISDSDSASASPVVATTTDGDTSTVLLGPYPPTQPAAMITPDRLTAD